MNLTHDRAKIFKQINQLINSENFEMTVNAPIKSKNFVFEASKLFDSKASSILRTKVKKPILNFYKNYKERLYFSSLDIADEIK